VVTEIGIVFGAQLSVQLQHRRAAESLHQALTVIGGEPVHQLMGIDSRKEVQA